MRPRRYRADPGADARTGISSRTGFSVAHRNARRKKPAMNRREFIDAAGKYSLGGIALSTVAGSGSGYALQTRNPAGQTDARIAKLSRFVANIRYDSIPP